MRPISLALNILVRGFENDTPWPGNPETVNFNDEACPSIEGDNPSFKIERGFVVFGGESLEGTVDESESPGLATGWQYFTEDDARDLIPGWAAASMDWHAATKIFCSNNPSNFWIVSDSYYNVLSAFTTCCGAPQILTNAFSLKASPAPLIPGTAPACGVPAAFKWLALLGNDDDRPNLVYRFEYILRDSSNGQEETFIIGPYQPLSATTQEVKNWPADFLGAVSNGGIELVNNDIAPSGSQRRVMAYDGGTIEVRTIVALDESGDYTTVNESEETWALPGTVCGSGCLTPWPESLALPDALENVPYSQTIQLEGAAPFSLQVVGKPAWATVSISSTGLLSVTGTPTAAGAVEIDVKVENCGEPAADAETRTIPLTVLETVEFPLLNFNDMLVPGLPFGLFREDEEFIGVAISMQDAADLWNNEPDLAAIATAYPIPGNESALILVLQGADPLPDIRAMRYWRVNVNSGTPNIYLSGSNLLQKGDGTFQKANTGTLGTYTGFGLNASSYGIGASIPLVDTTSPYYLVPASLGQNRIFHNEDGEWAWLDVFGSWSNNHDNLPPTVRFLGIQCFGQSNVARNLAVSNFTNYATAISNVEAISFNGAPVVYDSFIIPLMPNLKTWQMIDTAGTLRELADLGLSAAQTPNLEWIGYRRNNAGAALQINQAWFEALPQLKRGIDLYGAQLEPSANVDAGFNGLAISQAATVPVANARITLIGQNAARTSASDAAVAVLTGRPFAIVS